MFMQEFCGTHRQGDVVVHAEDDDLRGNISYADVCEHLGILKRNLAGHCSAIKKKILSGAVRRAMQHTPRRTLHDTEGDYEVLHAGVHYEE